MDSSLSKLYRFPKSVLTIKELALLWQETDPVHLRARAAYYVKHGALIRLTRGVYSKDKRYDAHELAASIYAPSYISFETALRTHGVIFQHYDTIFVAAGRSKTLKLDGHVITYRKLKDEILWNSAGISVNTAFSMAGKERALIDTLYLFPRYAFDNLRAIDWDICAELSGIYHNKQLEKRLFRLRTAYAQ